MTETSLAEFNKEMIDMFKRENKLESGEFATIRDLVNHQFLNITYGYLSLEHYFFIGFYIIPITLVLLNITTDSRFIQVCCYIALISQSVLLAKEVLGLSMALFTLIEKYADLARSADDVDEEKKGYCCDLTTEFI